MKKVYLVITLFLVQHSAGWAQQKRCSSAEYLQELKENDTAFAQRRLQSEAASQQWIAAHQGEQQRSVISIPVVFHMLWNDSSQYLDDNVVQSQLDVINEDYQRLNADSSETPLPFRAVAANCGIEFCLARRTPSGAATNGIIHKFTTVSAFNDYNDPKFNGLGGDDVWDPSRYLNIWVAAFINPNFLGIGTFPGGDPQYDGVVINYKACGRIGAHLMDHYNKGRSLTHEIGHWMSLIHVWGDDGSTCSFDDQVSDTPLQAGETYGCPAYPKTDSCSASFPGIMFMNYMDYTDDECMNIFTNGQKMIMLSALNVDRTSLLTSNGCIPVGIEENELKNYISVFPNPATDQFTVNTKTDMKMATLVNMLGENMITIQPEPANGIFTVDISNMPAGIYFLKIHAEKGEGVFKIVKE